MTSAVAAAPALRDAVAGLLQRCGKPPISLAPAAQAHLPAAHALDRSSCLNS